MPEAVSFVAREEELVEMHRLLFGHSNRTIVVLHGLGGIGKTQLAIRYLTRHKEKYTSVFWLNATDEDSLKLSFRNVAVQILKDHPSTDMLADVDIDGDLDQVVDKVKDWFYLRENKKWLLVFDNHDNPKLSGRNDNSTVDLHRFLPGSDHGSIIITTRSSRVSHGQRLHVKKLLSHEESLEILSVVSQREGIDNGMSFMHQSVKMLC